MSYHITFNSSPRIISSGGGGGQPTVGFLLPGHYVQGPMSANVIYPRPDNETGGVTGRGRANRAYYDAVNPVQYENEIIVQGGTGPKVYQVTAGPAWLQIGQAYGSPMYGVAYGVPTSSISKASPVACNVRVWNQDLTYIDVPWSLATSNSTADFVFTNSTGSSQTINGVTIGVGNDSTGTGTLAAPFASLIPVMGTNASLTTLPSAMVYMVGNQQWPQRTGDSTGYLTVNGSKIPVVYMTLPGASVTIDASLVELQDNSSPGFTDLYFSGSGSPAFGYAATLLTINGGPAAGPPSVHTFECYNNIRCNWRNVVFTNPVSRSTDGNNCSSIMGSNSGIVKNYWSMLNVSESGRTIVGGAGSVDLLCCLFSVSNVVMQFCNATGAAPFGCYIKDSNEFVTVAYSQFHNTNNSLSLQFGGQTNNGRAGNAEACYNYIHGVMFFDFQAFPNNDSYWSYRNTIYNDGFDYGYALGNWGQSGTGPYYTNSDVLVSKTQAISTSGAPFIASNTEVQSIWAGSPPPSNNPVDPTTGNLVNASTLWKNLYSKTANSRGWEIG